MSSPDGQANRMVNSTICRRFGRGLDRAIPSTSPRAITPVKGAVPAVAGGRAPMCPLDGCDRALPGRRDGARPLPCGQRRFGRVLPTCCKRRSTGVNTGQSRHGSPPGQGHCGGYLIEFPSCKRGFDSRHPLGAEGSVFAESANLGPFAVFLGLSPQTPRQGGLRPPAPPFGLGFAFALGSWGWDRGLVSRGGRFHVTGTVARLARRADSFGFRRGALCLWPWFRLLVRRALTCFPSG